MKKESTISKVNKWMLWGVIVLAVLLIVWLSILFVGQADTAGEVMQQGQEIISNTPAN